MVHQDASLGKSVESMEEEDGSIFPNGEDSTMLETSHESDSQRNHYMDKETVKSDDPETEKDQIGKPTSEEKIPLKKPDKILPCPRCNSMDTKFCYYNNYNVNQPRHFCKSCQRYWTSGGTMRNVPVGAGRRKNKSCATTVHHNFRDVTISDAALHAACVNVPPNGSHLAHVKSNGKVINFGLETLRYDSASSALHSFEKKVLNGVRLACSNNGDECSSGSSITVSNTMEEGTLNGKKEHTAVNPNGCAPQIQCLPWPPYPIPHGNAVPFYPAASFWNCGVQGTWNLPPCLGKHPRDQGSTSDVADEVEKSSKLKNRCILVPKTLRLDDPKEAAKSTIWSTLGIKQGSSTNHAGCLLKPFHPKGEDKNNQGPETSPVLCANPAALSRSLNFHEAS